MKKEFQPTQHLLRAAADQGDDMLRPQESVTGNKPDDLTVANGELYGDGGSAFETR
jgi:hypothetical protein